MELVSGTISRILDPGDGTRPWRAELITGDKAVYVVLNARPEAGIGDDLHVVGNARKPVGEERIIQPPEFDQDIARIAERAINETSSDSLNSTYVPDKIRDLIHAQRQSDLKLSIDSQSISVIRPTTDVLEILSYFQNATTGFRDGPRIFVNQTVLAQGEKAQERLSRASPAGAIPVAAGMQKPNVATIELIDNVPRTGVYEIFLGEGHASTFMRTWGLASQGWLIPIFPPSPAVLNEFEAVHEVAHSFDAISSTIASYEHKRTMESFCDAVAVLTLMVHGRNPAEVEKIVAAREASLVGHIMDSRDGLDRWQSPTHLSGPAARAALNVGKRLRAEDEKRSIDWIIEKAWIIAQRHTLGDEETKALKDKLSERLRGTRPSAAGMAEVLKVVAGSFDKGSVPRRAATWLASHVARSCVTVADLDNDKSFAKVSSRYRKSVGETCRSLLETKSTKGLAAAFFESEARRLSAIASIPEPKLQERLLSVLSGKPKRMTRLAALRKEMEGHLNEVKGNTYLGPASSDTGPAFTKWVVGAWIPPEPNPWSLGFDQRLRHFGVLAAEAHDLAIEDGPGNYGESSTRYREKAKQLIAFAEALSIEPKDQRRLVSRFGTKPIVEAVGVIRDWRHGEIFKSADKVKLGLFSEIAKETVPGRKLLERRHNPIQNGEAVRSNHEEVRGFYSRHR